MILLLLSFPQASLPQVIHVVIRDAMPRDIPGLTRIYNQAVVASSATFDLRPQTIEERTEWFSHYGGTHPLIVAESDGRVLGYCSLSHFRPKPAYDHTVESSVYVDNACHGQGIGKALMRAALARAQRLGHHVVIAGITAGNEASVRLHESLGFRRVGQLREVGRKFDRWQDVHFYQLVLPQGETAEPGELTL
jgi:phosphinothricin acetyltransferase